MAKVRITTTGLDSADVEPIVLRDGTTTRMVFKPQLVNNKRDESRPVRGQLLWQKRGKAQAVNDWVDEADLKLTSMTAGAGVKLALNADELYLLTQVVRGLYGVYWKHGKQLPANGEEFDLAEYAQAARSLDKLDAASQVIEAIGEAEFVSLMKRIALESNVSQVMEGLSKLDFSDLAAVNALAGIGLLRKALEVWATNRSNSSESFWQNTLSSYSFVFSQVFSSPVTVFGEKTFVGGKNVMGAGGKEPDFLLRNELTSHLLIVEIKTPATELLQKSPYREPDTYVVTREVAGAVTQAAVYKDTFLKNYGYLYSQSDGGFRLIDPKCLVVVGDTKQLDSKAKLDSLEHFRRALRGIEVITFDELFEKVELLLGLLEGRAAS